MGGFPGGNAAARGAHPEGRPTASLSARYRRVNDGTHEPRTATRWLPAAVGKRIQKVAKSGSVSGQSVRAGSRPIPAAAPSCRSEASVPDDTRAFLGVAPSLVTRPSGKIVTVKGRMFPPARPNENGGCGAAVAAPAVTSVPAAATRSAIRTQPIVDGRARR